MGLLKILLAIFFPPLAVLLERGVGSSLLINVLLTLIGIIPGIIHAFFVIAGSPATATA